MDRYVATATTLAFCLFMTTFWQCQSQSPYFTTEPQNKSCKPGPNATVEFLCHPSLSNTTHVIWKWKKPGNDMSFQKINATDNNNITIISNRNGSLTLSILCHTKYNDYRIVCYDSSNHTSREATLIVNDTGSPTSITPFTFDSTLSYFFPSVYSASSELTINNIVIALISLFIVILIIACGC